MKIFLSFSGREQTDRDFVTRLLFRLNEQAPDLAWIYERRGTEIPLGSSIEDHCRKMIQQASLFIALITATAFESEYAKAEVEEALCLAELDGRSIFPVSLCSQDRASWPAPYSRLAHRKIFSLTNTDYARMEELIQQVCHDLAILYFPPNEDYGSLPLLRRVFHELNGRLPKDRPHAMGVIHQCYVLASSFVSCYRVGDLDGASGDATELVRLLEREFPTHTFYYPYLVKHDIDIKRAQSVSRQVFERACENAERDLSGLLDEAAAEVDENIYAALGFLRLSLGDAEAARECYLAAAQAAPGADPDIAYNVLVTSIVLRRDLPSEHLDTLLGHGKLGELVLRQGDTLRLDLLRAACACYLGQHSVVSQMLARGLFGETLPVDLVLWISDRLRESGDEHQDRFFFEIAARLLDSILTAFPNAHSRHLLLHRAGRLHFDLGNFARAGKVYRELVGGAPNYPQFLVEAAVCADRLGETAYARSLATQASEVRLSQISGDSISEEDYEYYKGFALWILGQKDKANIRFGESGYEPEFHYSKLYSAHEHYWPLQWVAKRRRFSVRH